jgi:hypothetical protein
MGCNEYFHSNEQVQPRPILDKKLLVVEGKDEVNFFSWLLEKMSITGVDIRDACGKYKFKEELTALYLSTGFSDVEIFVIVQDADEDADKAFSSLTKILLELKLDPPKTRDQISEGKSASPKIGIFIMPGYSINGMLEDLCLKTVSEHPAMRCVEKITDCISRLGEPPKNMAKSKVQVFLACMPDIVSSLGLGAKKGYWDFNSEKLNDLKAFLEYLR